MATAYTTLLGLALPVTGELNGTWGDVVNDSITELVEDAIAGSATASVTSADWTLTTTGSGAANQARSAILIPTGTPGVSRNIIAPSSSKAYIVDNQSNAAVVVKGSATTGVSIAAGTAALVAWDGTDFVLVAQDLANVTGVLAVAKGGTGATTLTGVLKGSGTSAVTASNVNLASEVTGTLPVANGGTGQTTYTNGQLLIGNTTGNTLAKATLTQGSGVTITNGAGTITIAATGSGGTVTSVASGTGLTGGPITTTGTLSVATNGISDTLLRDSAALSVIGRSANSTGDPADIAAASDHQVLRRSGTAVGFGAVALNQANAVTGTLPVANGGTGATTLTANNVLLGNGTSALQVVAPGTTGNVLVSNGSTWTSAAPTGGSKAADVQTFNSSGTWTKPTGFGADSRVYIQLWGGGGSGGRGSNAAGGGGGGGYNERWIDLSSLGATETVTVGAGGTGKTTNLSGTVGGNSSLGSFITAFGGGGGAASSTNNAAGGGGGGGQLSAGGTITAGRPGSDGAGGGTSEGARNGNEGFFKGGGGGGQPIDPCTNLGVAGGVGATTVYGGSGGGAATNASTTAGGAAGIYGGAGGGGSNTGDGTAGTAPGGGGGGTRTGTTSGAGAAGRIIVTVFDGA